MEGVVGGGLEGVYGYPEEQEEAEGGGEGGGGW